MGKVDKSHIALHNLMDIFCLHDSEMPSFHLDAAVESQLDGDSACAYMHLTELFYDELATLQNDNTARHLFRFSKIPKKEVDFVDNPLIQDILHDSITLSNPKGYNDPMDPILWEWLRIQKQIEPDKVERKVYKMESGIIAKHLRMCCLVDPNRHTYSNMHRTTGIEGCSLLMWAHYAWSHRGICIEYEITPDEIEAHNDVNHVLRLCDIRYRDRKAMSDYITIDNALLAKADCWEYENETRLLYYTKRKADWYDDNGKVKDYVTIPGFKVKAVYMGYRIPHNDSVRLQQLLSHRDIALYQMEFCQDDITKLVPRRIC